MLGIGMDLQRTYRQGYALRSAQLGDHAGARRRPTTLVLEVLGHYATASIVGAAAGHAARHAAAVGAALAARPAQPVPDHPLLAGAPAGRADARRAAPIRASATSRAAASTSATTCSARRASASSTAGASRRRIRRRRCPSRSSRSSTGSTARIPLKYRDADHRRHPRVEQGVREDRLQERDRGRGAARRRRLRHARLRRRLDALDDQRRRRPSARSARATSIRAAARSSTPTSASRACRRATCRAARSQVLDRRSGVDSPFARRRRRRAAGSCAPAASTGPRLHATATRRRADDLRPRRARGARRARPRQPRGRGLRPGLPEGRDDARGRPHARPAPQLPRLARLHASSSWPTRSSRKDARHRRLGDGLPADQPAAAPTSRATLRHAVQRHARARTTTGRSSTPTSRCRRACRPPTRRPR